MMTDRNTMTMDKVVAPYIRLMTNMNPLDADSINSRIRNIRSSMGFHYDPILMSQALRHYCMSSNCANYTKCNIPPQINRCINNDSCQVMDISTQLEDEAIANGRIV